jgi:hypothetical protein
MHMVTYARALRTMQPIIDPLYEALVIGLRGAGEVHTTHGLARADDPWYYVHTARRLACEHLRSLGIQAENDETGRPLLAMSGIMIYYRDLAIRVLHTQPRAGTTDKPAEIPLPGHSIPRQHFWGQHSALPGLQTDNHLLLWLDKDGVLVDRMTLIRPLSGDHRRSSLRLHWEGPVLRQMAQARAADLDELLPDVEYPLIDSQEG